MLGYFKTIMLATLALALALPASAQRGPRDRDWVLLGEQEVGFRIDRDAIDVAREGVRFSQLRIEADRNDVYMMSLRLVYQNGYAEEFRVERELRAGQEALPIDLRGERSYLKRIEMTYRARPDFRGRALVRVYGELRHDRRPPEVAAGRFEIIETQQIFRRSRDAVSFSIGAREGAFSKLRFQAKDGDIRIEDVRITFANGETQRTTLDDRLDDGQLSRIIDLDGERRRIDRILVQARPARGDRAATLVLLGEKSLRRRGPDLGDFKPIDKQRITRRTDDGIVEFDVGRDEGRFSELRFLAEEGDIFIREATIVFGNGEVQQARVRDKLNDGELSETIDLQGERRFIRKVTVRARLARGERDATMILLAKEDEGRRRRGWGPQGHGVREEWVTLGRQRAAILKADTDVFRVGRDMGTFRAIRILVNGPNVRFYDMQIKYGNGSIENVPLSGTIRNGEVSKPFDLQGRDRFIDSITFKYRSQLSLAGPGTIEIQGLKHGPYRGR